MDPQELEQLQQQLKQLNENFAELGVSVNKAEQNFSDTFGKKFPNAGPPTIAALKGLGNAATDAAAALYRGERGAKVMANAFDKIVDGVQTAVAIFTWLTPVGRGLKLGSKLLLNGAAAAGKAFSTFNKLSAEQSDKLFETYQDLSKIGAAGAGVEQMFENLQRMGLTSAEISQYTAVLKKNARELSAFGASTADGARNLSAISGAITKGRLGEQLMMMGYTAEDIASSTASYMQLQTRLGRLQLKTATEIANESGRYAIELDKMARLTGMAREEQEAERASHVEDERYAGFLAGEAERMGYDIQAFEQSLTGLPEEVQRGMRHLASGRGGMNSAEAKKMAQMDPEAYQRSLAVLEGRMSPIEARQQTALKGLEFTKRFADQIAIGATQGGEGYGLPVAGKRGIYMQGRTAEATQAAAEKLGMGVEEYLDYEQKRAVEGDKATASQVKLRREQMSAAQSLDTFVNLGVKPATSAMATFATAVERTARGLPGAPAGGRPTTGGGGGGSSRSVMPLGRGGGLNDKIAGAESGGNYNAKNPLSSATGKYQFLKSTFEGLVSGARPGEALYGKTWEDYKRDPAIQEAAMSAFTSQNQSWLQKNGINPTNSATYMAHWFGPGGAVAILKSPPGTQLSSLLGPSVFSQNPNISPGMTVDQLKTIVDNKIGGGYRTGGIASGPMSGYSTTLHGVEAVVPLPDGKTIPVSFNMEDMVNRLANVIRQPNGFNGGGDTSNLMAQQITRLDELINQMRNQVNISQKILQYAK